MRSHSSTPSSSSSHSHQHPGTPDTNDDAAARTYGDLTRTSPRSQDQTNPAHRHRAPLPAEILQEILQYLDFRTLAQSQRVSRVWEAAIARSPRLQQALFLSSGGTKEIDGRRGAALVVKIVVDTQMKPVTATEQEQEQQYQQQHTRPIFSIDLSKHFTHSYYPHRDHGSLDADELSFNPILLDLFRATHLLDPGSSNNNNFDTLRIHLTDPENPSTYQRTIPGLRPSWRNMFISQPPVQTLTMECDFTFDPAYRCKSWTPYNVPGGIRLEGLLLLVQSLVESSFDDYLRDERCRLRDAGVASRALGTPGDAEATPAEE